MGTALAMAAVFIGAGALLLASAARTRRAGRAVTDEDDVYHRQAQPVRFFLFVFCQFAFGGIFVIAGVLLAVAAIVTT